MFQTGNVKTNSAQLGLNNVGGVFIVLLGGLIVACIIAIFEFMWSRRKLAVDSNVRNTILEISGI